MPSINNTPAKRALNVLLKTVDKGRREQIKRTQDARKEMLALWAAAGLEAEASSDPEAVLNKAQATSALLTARAWETAETAARKDSVRERKKPAAASANRAYLELILRAALSNKSEVVPLVERVLAASRSWSAAAATASARAYNEGHAAQVSGAQKGVWVTAFRINTCGACVALHGTVVDVGNSFNESATLGSSSPPTFGKLDMPPRHPNCGCRVVILPDEAEHATYEMRAYANEWASKAANMAPSTSRLEPPSETAKTTSMLTASDIRALPQAAYDKLKRLFLAAMVKSGVKSLWGENGSNND